MKLLSSLFIAILLCSCVTQKRCQEKFPSKDSVSVVTSIRDSIVFVHDTVLLPYQEITFTDESPCPPQVVYHKSVTNKGLTTTVDIKDGKISSKCAADSLKVALENEKHYVYELHQKIIKLTNEKPVEYMPWWAKPALYISLIYLFLTAIYLAWKLNIK